uniref:Uncharacterized protein n=1 Tax=Aegilops tauschii subsp. strangulata TaxID=200361 RepID=A0A452Y6C0_AEGTS
SIHCAQKEPATTEMCKYRNFLPGFEEIDDIIDLTSPAAHTPKTWDNAKTCYYPMRTRNYENYVSSSQKNKKSYLTTPFIGKRLFTDEVIEEDDQDGTKDQPIPVIDELQVNLCFRLFCVPITFFYVLLIQHKLIINVLLFFVCFVVISGRSNSGGESIQWFML